MQKSKKTGDLRSQLARALADYDNLKKRTETERQQFVKLANLGLVGRLLPVLDMLVSAQNHLRDSGLTIAIKEFQTALAEIGVEEIRVQKSDQFDAALHEAIEVADPSTGSGQDGKIEGVLLTGWRVKDGPVIRHTKVRVTREKGNR